MMKCIIYIIKKLLKAGVCITCIYKLQTSNYKLYVRLATEGGDILYSTTSTLLPLICLLIFSVSQVNKLINCLITKLQYLINVSLSLSQTSVRMA